MHSLWLDVIYRQVKLHWHESCEKKNVEYSGISRKPVCAQMYIYIWAHFNIPVYF